MLGRDGDNPLDLDWLCPDESLSHLQLARWIEKHVPSSSIRFRANSLIALREAARVGLGVAVLSNFTADPDPGLVRIMPPRPETASSLWLMTHPNLRRMPRVRAVLDVIADFVSERRPLLEADDRHTKRKA
jgi:DNA-binding transcriptional LysR family regulator